MVVLIISGAILGGVIFQDFTFSLLGALLGFVVARMNNLSQQLNELKRSVHRLQNSKIADHQPKSEQAKDEIKEVGGLQEQPSEVPTKKVYVTHSTAKSSHSEEIKITEGTTTPGGTEPFIPTEQSTSTEPKTAVEKTIHESTTTSQNQNQNQNQNQAKSVNKNSQVNENHEPDFIMKITNFVIDYFTHGNIVVRVGAVILFFGVAFLLKYASENVEIPMEFRLIAVSIGAIILLIFGWRLRNKKQGYGLILQGTAVGILYLTLFASFRLYDMVPAGFAFSLMFLFSGLAMTLAVLQNARSLAILSVAGGFLAPILTSTGSGNHVGLFSYYSILNLGIFAVAWFKSWRLLNLIGFVFTFVISTAWGITKYQATDFATTEPFLILFFLLYSAIALLFATRQKPTLKGYLDTTLIFGLPLISFALQAAMVVDYEYGLAWSSFALGAFYMVCAYLILRTKNDFLKVIAEAYLALGIIFVSLVIPFALDGQWTAASWAIEGAGLVWVGLRQSRWFPKYFGTLIQLIGGIIFLSEIKFNYTGESFFDAETIGIIFVSIAALFSSFQIWQRRESLPIYESMAFLLFLIWGLLWWYLGGIGKISDHLAGSNQVNGIVIFVSLSGLFWYLLETRFQWKTLSQLTWVTLPLFVLVGLENLTKVEHLMTSWASLFWSFAIASFYWILYHRETYEKTTIKLSSESDVYIPKLPAASNILHFVTFIALFGFSIQEIAWLTTYFEFSNTGWSVSVYGLAIAAWLYLLRHTNIWPISFNLSIYSFAAAGSMLFCAVIWSFLLNFPHSGNVDPLIYVPFINPLDIVQGFIFILAFQSVQKLVDSKTNLPTNFVKIISSGFMFIWLNVILLRCLHHWSNVPYDFNEMYRSFLVQTSLSIFWTVIGLAGTIFGARVSSRKIWVVAASLLGVVVFKLFTIDLDASSSIERIVSFVVVGLLLLIVGYFSPLPPKEGTKNESGAKAAETN